jgi:hypothetical protein
MRLFTILLILLALRGRTSLPAGVFALPGR